MSSRSKIEISACIIILIAGYFLFNSVMGLRAEEPRRALTGAEALLGENPLVPTIQGQPYFNKPPLYNWVLAASFSIAGSYSPAAARLPGVLSIWACAALLFFFVRYHSGQTKALASSLIFLTFGDLLMYGSVNAGEIDLFFSFLIFGQIASIYHFGVREKYLAMFLISYFIAAIGVLTKGLPSIAFQGLTLIGFLIWSGEWKRLFSIKHIYGIILFVAVAGGYFYLYSDHGDALGYLVNLWSESSEKSANEAGYGKILEALYTFPLQVLKITAPWCLLLIGFKRNSFKNAKLVRFSLLFIGVNLWLYWISPDLRDRYLYPFLPFFAIVLSDIAVNLCQSVGFNRNLIKTSGILSLVLGIAFMLLPFLGVLPEEYTNSLPFLIAGSVFILMALYQWRFDGSAIIRLVLVLSWLRVAYNLAVLPVQAESGKTAYYEEQMEEMMEIAGGAEIFWTGESYSIYPRLSLFGEVLYEAELRYPPPVAFQIPYEYIASKGERMIYTDTLSFDKWYLGPEDFAKKIDGRIYHEFEDRAASRKVVLYQLDKR